MAMLIGNMFSKDTMYDERNQLYYYSAFYMDRIFIAMNPHFDWPLHISDSISTCLKNATNRFLKVV